MDVNWTNQDGGADMGERIETVSDFGEIRLLNEIILPCVTSGENSLNDDCAHLTMAGKTLLWSMDPCPTPVANWFGKATPEVWGCYTAAINLSDIAASGGTPLGMLVSIEMPDNTPVSFIKGFQDGLLSMLNSVDAKLYGGNVKSSKRFSATGTIIGTPGENPVTRKTTSKEVLLYLIGPCGDFWAAVVANRYGAGNLRSETVTSIDRAMCFPVPQVSAGRLLSNLPFSVACMDCSDGPANSLYQLARINQLDIQLASDVIWPLRQELLEFLSSNGIRVENACYSFGDWQLACLVPSDSKDEFERSLSGYTLTKLGSGTPGLGRVTTDDGRFLQLDMINQNFSSGYNSIENLDDLIQRYMRNPIFQ